MKICEDLIGLKLKTVVKAWTKRRAWSVIRDPWLVKNLNYRDEGSLASWLPRDFDYKALNLCNLEVIMKLNALFNSFTDLFYQNLSDVIRGKKGFDLSLLSPSSLLNVWCQRLALPRWRSIRICWVKTFIFWLKSSNTRTCLLLLCDLWDLCGECFSG